MKAVDVTLGIVVAGDLDWNLMRRELKDCFMLGKVVGYLVLESHEERIESAIDLPKYPAVQRTNLMRRELKVFSVWVWEGKYAVSGIS